MRTDWKMIHRAAFNSPRRHEKPIVQLLNALDLYAANHERLYESPIGEDGVLGAAFLDMAKGLVRLLDGETGRLDCGTLWGDVDRLLRASGFEKGLDT